MFEPPLFTKVVKGEGFKYYDGCATDYEVRTARARAASDCGGCGAPQRGGLAACGVFRCPCSGARGPGTVGGLLPSSLS